jgi:hypothetical protein
MKYATVNFRFKVPVEYDDVGRRIPPVNTAVKYLEPTLVNLKLGSEQDMYHYDEEKDKMYIEVGKAFRHHFKDEHGMRQKMGERAATSIKAENNRLQERYDTVKRTYGMSYLDWDNYTHGERGVLRKIFQARYDDSIEVELPPEEKDRLRREWVAALDRMYKEVTGYDRAGWNALPYAQQYPIYSQQGLRLCYGGGELFEKCNP